MNNSIHCRGLASHDVTVSIERLITIMYRVGGSKETWHYCYKTVNMYTLMKMKLTFIIKQPQIYYNENHVVNTEK